MTFKKIVILIQSFRDRICFSIDYWYSFVIDSMWMIRLIVWQIYDRMKRINQNEHRHDCSRRYRFINDNFLKFSFDSSEFLRIDEWSSFILCYFFSSRAEMKEIPKKKKFRDEKMFEMKSFSKMFSFSYDTKHRVCRFRTLHEIHTSEWIRFLFSRMTWFVE